MKIQVRSFVFVFVFCCLSYSTFAQVTLSTLATNAGGDSFQSGELQMEWSIGEMVVVNTSFTPDVIVSKGVLQPSRPRATGGNIFTGLKVYPTLTTGKHLFISGSFDKSYSMSLRFLNSIGQQVGLASYRYNMPFFTQQSELPFIVPGTYFLEVTLTSTDLTEIHKKTYKIQKQ